MVSPLTDKIGKETSYCACHRNLLRNGEKLRQLCQSADSIGKLKASLRIPPVLAVV